MYKIMIIPDEIALKLKNTKFEGCEFIDPVKYWMNDKEVYVLNDKIKENPAFTEVMQDFEVCEIKDIETIETKSYDSKGLETTDPTKAVTTKTILTETINGITKSI